MTPEIFDQLDTNTKEFLTCNNTCSTILYDILCRFPLFIDNEKLFWKNALFFTSCKQEINYDDYFQSCMIMQTTLNLFALFCIKSLNYVNQEFFSSFHVEFDNDMIRRVLITVITGNEESEVAEEFISFFSNILDYIMKEVQE